jgi:predicted RNase H-like HicB family nuclease
MRYVVAVEKGNKKHSYGVVVPDLPGCFSAGDSLDEALSNSKEAILLHLEGLMDERLEVPAPKSIEAHQKSRAYQGWIWAVVEVDMTELDDKTERINITLPRKVLRVIDAAAKRNGESRSGYLARVGIEAMRRAG